MDTLAYLKTCTYTQQKTFHHFVLHRWNCLFVLFCTEMFPSMMMMSATGKVAQEPSSQRVASHILTNRLVLPVVWENNYLMDFFFFHFKWTHEQHKMEVFVRLMLVYFNCRFVTEGDREDSDEISDFFFFFVETLLINTVWTNQCWNG